MYIPRGGVVAIIGSFVVVNIVVILTLNRYGFLNFNNPVKVPAVQVEEDYGSSRPLAESNIFFIAVAVNNISDSLNSSIKKINPELPPVKLFDSKRSYRTADSWLAVGDDVIFVFLFSDITSVLNKEEIEAYAAHEVGHVELKHIQKFKKQRDIKEEVAADLFAVEAGIRPEVLISAIDKLSINNTEKDQRISVLKTL